MNDCFWLWFFSLLLQKWFRLHHKYWSTGNLSITIILISSFLAMPVNPINFLYRSFETIIESSRFTILYRNFTFLISFPDTITQQLSHLLGWTGHIHERFKLLTEISKEEARKSYWESRNPDPMTPEDFDIVALREMYDSRNLGAWIPGTNNQPYQSRKLLVRMKPKLNSHDLNNKHQWSYWYTVSSWFDYSF